MRITRVTRIRGHRVFRDFTWPSALHGFGQFNLRYGWSGCGKTTFSTLFAHVDKGATIPAAGERANPVGCLGEGSIQETAGGNEIKRKEDAVLEQLTRVTTTTRRHFEIRASACVLVARSRISESTCQW